MSVTEEVRRRFEERIEMSERELCEVFGMDSGTEADALREGLAPFVEEYGVVLGALRPSDSLGWFVEPHSTKNPFKWVAWRGVADDKAVELRRRLGQLRQRRGLALDVPFPVDTVGDYVAASMGDHRE